jgi:hypothetical protein
MAKPDPAGWIGAAGRSAPLMSPDPRLRRGSPPNTSLRSRPLPVAGVRMTSERRQSK